MEKESAKYVEKIKSSGLSIPKLAEKLKIPAQRIYGWTIKGAHPKHEDVEKLKIFFGDVPQETMVNEPEASYIGSKVGIFKTKSREFIELSDGHYIMHVPLVNQKAYAGYLTGWGDNEFVEELPRHPILVDKPHKGEYISFEVKGDSMDDGTDKAIQDGDIITGRKIERSLWKSKLHLKKYSEFVIVTIKKGIIVKNIIDHDTSANEITCRSYNTDKGQYPDFKVNLDTVMQLFNVIQVTKKRRV